MEKEEFDKLSESAKRTAVSKSLAWFTVNQLFNFYHNAEEEIDTIKIILGKYMNGELVEKEV